MVCGGCKAGCRRLIRDSTYDANGDLNLGHAALGVPDPNEISLGVFGSHLTNTWPRLLEEVLSSLLGITITNSIFQRSFRSYYAISGT